MTEKLRLLLWLRFRTLLRRRSTGALVALAIGYAILVPFSIGVGWLTFSSTRSLSGNHPELVAEWAHLVFLGCYFMIVVMPVVGFGGQEFYDITKLFHLPVSHREVFVAQAVGLTCGGTVLILLPSLVGLVVALPGGVLLTLLRLGGLLLFLFHAVALGQLIQLALLNTLRTRRFRDVAMIAGMLIWGALFVGFRLLFETGADRGALDPDLLVPVLTRLEGAWYLVIVPSYWVSSVLSPGAGAPWLLLFVLGFLPLTGLLVVISAFLQERAFHGEIPVAKVKAVARAERPGRDAPWPLSRIPGDVRAVAGKELRLLWREPAVKRLLIGQLVFFMVPVGIAMWRAGRENLGDALQIGAFVFLFVESNLLLNLLGLEAPGIAHLLTTPVRRGRILAGKLLAYFALWQTVNLILAGAICAVLAALGHPLPASQVVNLFVGVTAALLVLMGIGAVVSTLAPIGLSARGRRALAQGKAQREGCLVQMQRGVSFLVLAVLLVPVALLCYPWGLGVISLFSLPYGAGLLLAGGALGTRILESREERLLLALARSPD